MGYSLFCERYHVVLIDHVLLLDHVLPNVQVLLKCNQCILQEKGNLVLQYLHIQEISGL